jgi:hypothetical protein
MLKAEFGVRWSMETTRYRLRRAFHRPPTLRVHLRDQDLCVLDYRVTS